MLGSSASGADDALARRPAFAADGDAASGREATLAWDASGLLAAEGRFARGGNGSCAFVRPSACDANGLGRGKIGLAPVVKAITTAKAGLASAARARGYRYDAVQGHFGLGTTGLPGLL